MRSKTTLKEAVRFHGHLGPYLVLGLKAGELALKKLNCKKYFGLDVLVQGASKKPKSCLIDGLQLSTGATYGKGNIAKLNGRLIRIEFCNRLNKKKLILNLKDSVLEALDGAITHRDSEILAKTIYKTDKLKLFDFFPKSL